MRQPLSDRAGKLAVRPRRKRRQPRPLSPEERHARELGRAWNWGRRYSRMRWRRRPPPRYRSTGPRDEAGIELSRAFLGGYDAQTRITNRLRRGVPTAISWPAFAARLDAPPPRRGRAQQRRTGSMIRFPQNVPTIPIRRTAP